jgi:hypothetical protein
MSIFQSAFDTTACFARTHSLEQVLEKGLARGSFRIENLTPACHEQPIQFVLVFGADAVADTVPGFYHPYVYASKVTKSEVIAIDCRPYGTWKRQDSRFAVTNPGELTWLFQRAVLEHHWRHHPAGELKDLSNLPSQIYATVIADTIARKLDLDPGAQVRMKIMAMFGYHFLFTDESQFEEVNYNKLVGKIAQLTHAPATIVTEVIEGLTAPITNLESLCEALKGSAQNIRTNNLNYGLLMSLMRGMWYGTNAGETMLVGLEHIPTWLMICYGSVGMATFKRTAVSKLAEVFSKGGDEVSFLRSIDSLSEREACIAMMRNFSQG